jgi:hypothetical protein
MATNGEPAGELKLITVIGHGADAPLGRDAKKEERSENG